MVMMMMMMTIRTTAMYQKITNFTIMPLFLLEGLHSQTIFCSMLTDSLRMYGKGDSWRRAKFWGGSMNS